MRKGFVVALCVVFLVVAIAFGVQLYHAKNEVIYLERRIFNMESRLRICQSAIPSSEPIPAGSKQKGEHHGSGKTQP